MPSFGAPAPPRRHQPTAGFKIFDSPRARRATVLTRTDYMIATKPLLPARVGQPVGDGIISRTGAERQIGVDRRRRAGRERNDIADNFAR